MEWLWTWGGKCFGYRRENELRTHDGRHVGTFQGNDVFGPDGAYLGEVLNGRLIRNLGKRNLRGGAFAPYAKYAAYTKYADYAGYAMYAGYEDFPSPEAL